MIILIIRLKYIFINQNRNHYKQHNFALRKQFVYSCSIKIHAVGFEELLERIFCLLLVVEAFSLQNFVEMLEEVAVGW